MKHHKELFINENKIPKTSCLKFFISLLILLFLFTPNRMNAEIEEMVPNKFDYNGLVPKSTALSIAKLKAQEVWGDVTVGNPLLAYDFSGEPSVYIIPIQLGKEKFPDDEIVLKELRDSHTEFKKAARECSIIRDRLSSAIENNESGNLNDDGEENTLKSLKRELEKAEAKLKAARNGLWGVGQYGFIAVSASFGMLPIQEYSNSLPSYFTRRDFTTSKVVKEFSTKNELTRVYYEGPMDQMFEYTAGNEKIWISPIGEIFKHLNPTS